MRVAGTLILLVIIYWPIIRFINKIDNQMIKILFFIFSVLLFPIMFLIILFVFPYYHLSPFEGKVIDAFTKEPIQGARINAVYTTSLPSIAGSMSIPIGGQLDYTDQNGEFRIKGASRWFGNKKHGYLIGNIYGHIKVYKNGYGHFPSALSHAVGFKPYEPPSDKYLVIELEPLTIECMIQALYSEKRNTRFDAAFELLSRFKTSQVTNPLINTLQKGNSFARESSAYALGRAISEFGRHDTNFSKNRAMEALIGALQDKEPKVRIQVIEALGKIRDRHAVEALIGALQDKEPKVRIQVIEVLGRKKVPRAVKLLIVALQDKEPGVRQSAAKTLGVIKDPAAVDPLILAAKDENIYVKRSAIWALGEFTDTRAVVPLIEELQNKNFKVRISAIDAIEALVKKTPNSRLNSALIAVLKDDNMFVRSDAARALGNIKDYRAVEPLITLLEDQGSDSNSRNMASWALGQIKDPRAIEPLINALSDDEGTVRYKAVTALKRITTKHSFSDDPSQWRDWFEQEKRRKKETPFKTIGE